MSRWLRRHRTLVAERVELSNGAREFLDASTRRDKRRRRRSTTVLSILLVLAVAAAGVAVQQGVTAQAHRDTAIHNQIASQADRLRAVDVSLAAQLDLVAHRIRPTPDLYTALVTMDNSALSTALAGHTDSVNSVAFSPDGRTMATGSGDKTVQLWNVTNPTKAVPLGPPLSQTNPVFALAFSPDGQTLA